MLPTCPLQFLQRGWSCADNYQTKRFLRDYIKHGRISILPTATLLIFKTCTSMNTTKKKAHAHTHTHTHAIYLHGNRPSLFVTHTRYQHNISTFHSQPLIKSVLQHVLACPYLALTSVWSSSLLSIFNPTSFTLKTQTPVCSMTFNYTALLLHREYSTAIHRRAI